MDNDFRHPAAGVRAVSEPTTTSQQPGPPPVKHKKPRRFHLWPRHWSVKKKRICTAILVVVLLAVIGAVGGYYWYRHNNRPTPVAQVEVAPEPPPPTTEISNLTGLEVPIGTNERPVIGVMIENSPNARPQSGLKDAGVVFEAVAEGGITRFLALFQDTHPDYVGPIRSARPYYLDWLMPFNAPYAHVGGSPDALADIRKFGVKDLDQFQNAGAYQRISQRFAPHNVYSNIATLYELAKQKGFTANNFTSFLRKKDAPVSPPPARVIDLSISGPLYSVHYDYDPATNSYLRSMASRPHVEERTGAQLSPRVVVALVMPSSLAGDRVHLNYNTVGSGQMFVFQDGTVTQGTWHKADRQSQFTFTDANGQPLAFNAGQTWFTMVKDAGSVTYGP